MLRIRTVAKSRATLVDGAPKPVRVTTSPAGVAVAVTYDGSPAPPVGPGSYAVRATVTTPGYVGAASGTLTLSLARVTIQPATISISRTNTITAVVHGSPVLDASRLTPASIRLRVPGGATTGAPVALRGGVPLAALRDVDGDGILDRELLFNRADCAAMLAPGALLVLEDVTGPQQRFRAAPAVPPTIVP